MKIGKLKKELEQANFEMFFQDDTWYITTHINSDSGYIPTSNLLATISVTPGVFSIRRNGVIGREHLSKKLIDDIIKYARTF